jgi:hypothetical protein
MKHLRPEGRKWTGEQPRGIAYWEGLAKIISEEPAIERDRIMLATLVPLGIEKGKPFAPNPRQKAILLDAAKTGEVMARTIGFAKRFDGAAVRSSKKWEYSLFLAETSQEKPNYTQLDERSSWFYEAVGVSAGMMGHTVGAGQVYLETSKDSTGAWLDGEKNYVLRVPKDAPVKQFWSFTVYDNESRCLIDTGTSRPVFARRHHDQRRRLGGSVLRAAIASRKPAEELDQDVAWQRLVHVLPLVRDNPTVLRQDVVAAGYRVGEVSRAVIEPGRCPRGGEGP